MFSDHYNIPSPLKEIESELASQMGIELYIKRDDLIHTLVSGNKLRKLKYNILNFQNSNYTGIISFGGAYSNHILALSSICNTENIPLKVFIRGDESSSNIMLDKFNSLGAEITFMDRETYKLRNDQNLLRKIQDENPNFYIIPEGGTNELALKGVGEMCDEIYDQNGQISHIILGVGSGGTYAGTLTRAHSELIGIAAVRDHSLEDKIKGFVPLELHSRVNLNFDYTLGGFAKWNPDLINFMNDFKKKFHIPLDPIYTGKTAYALFDLLRSSYFPKGSKICMIHTGGLYGVKGFNERFNDILL